MTASAEDAKGGPSPALLGLLVFALVTSVSLSVGSRLVRFEFADGAADGGEWFVLGRNLATFGVLGNGSEPVLHRPPGYPLWIAAVLRLAVDPRTHSIEEVNTRGPVALHIADSFLLGLASLLLFHWLAQRLRPSTALAASVLLGTNAYTLVSVTLLHYGTLQWVLLLGLVLYLDAAFKKRDVDALGRFFLGGLFLGIATLVRPVTLLAPLALLPVFLSFQSTRRERSRYLVFVLGMILSIAPWTARNFALTGRVIPINVQGWNALFASTSEVAKHNPDRYEWGLLTLRHYMPIYRSITGENEYTLETYQRNILRLEDAARDASLTNIAARPGTYLTNVRNAAVGLHTNINAVFLTAFTRMQTGEPFIRPWILIGVAKAMSRGPEANIFQFLHDLLLFAALGGLLLAAWRRDFFLLPALALWAAVVAVYALTYLDFFYYSVKIPFLVAFAFYGLDALPRAPRYGVTFGLSFLSLAISWSMRLFG